MAHAAEVAVAFFADVGDEDLAQRLLLLQALQFFQRGHQVEDHPAQALVVVVVVALGVQLAPGLGVEVEELMVADLGQFAGGAGAQRHAAPLEGRFSRDPLSSRLGLWLRGAEPWPIGGDAMVWKFLRKAEVPEVKPLAQARRSLPVKMLMVTVAGSIERGLFSVTNGGW